jgi:uncharacterized protein
MKMNELFSAYLGGLIFAIGLGVSGMTDANKVIDFLNLAGEWDPSLAFVMVGAISVHFILNRFILRKKSPIFAQRFYIPTRRDITAQLIIGSAFFGIGWGLSGFCPGPGLVSMIGSGYPAFTFVIFMLFGMGGHKIIHQNK